MAGPAEVLWSSTTVSLSILCLVAVLVMVKWWSGKTAAVDGGRGGKSAEERLEMLVKELEAAGDFDGAAAVLLSAWTKKGSARAASLAHELYQRYPAQPFQMGCPLQQGKRVSDRDGDDRHLASTTTEHDTDAGDAAVGDSDSRLSPAAASAEGEAATPNTGIGAAPERITDANGERGSPCPESRSNGNGKGGVVVRAAATRPGLRERNGNGDGERDSGCSDSEAPSPPTPTTSSTVTTPWERGWQGPEGFKPPPPSSSSESSGGAAVNPTPSSPSADIGSTSLSSRKREAEEGDLGGEQAAIPRNFTVSQLNAFDGGFPAPIVRGGVVKAKEARPIYIALRGVVYDASAGGHLYGPGGEYSEFAGHDISRRVARGIKDASRTSTDSAPLDDLSLEGLDRFEKMTLRGWEDTFKARGYPTVGRVVTPPPPRFFSRAELRAFDGRPAGGATSERVEGGGRRCEEEEEAGVDGKREGEGEGEAGAEGEAVPESGPVPIPAGYAARPIYMGVRDKVFDVSFGGSEFYVDGGPYECLAGRDASRVLAKMSMKPEDVEGVLDYASLSDREEKNLSDWVEKLGEGGKGYPVVGRIDLD